MTQRHDSQRELIDDRTGQMIRTNPPSELVYAERIAQVIELLQGKWTVHILCVLCKHPVRLGELSRSRCLEEAFDCEPALS